MARPRCIKPTTKMNSHAQSSPVSARAERGIYSASTRDISRSREFLRQWEMLTFKRAKARAPAERDCASEASRSSVEIERCEKDIHTAGGFYALRLGPGGPHPPPPINAARSNTPHRHP